MLENTNQIVIETTNTIIIKELNIEVEKVIHDKGKDLPSIKLPQGWRLLRFNEIQFLHNNTNYRKLLNLDNTWEFIEQPFEFNKEKGHVTAFYASPYGVSMYSDRLPRGSVPSMGVRFCRNLKQELKN